MTNWKNVATSLDPPIPEKDIEKLLPIMEALETAFRPLQQSIPEGAEPWTAAEDLK